ncbi:hypothetical protein FDF74_00065 [Clostridium niameyense]|uniref:Polysaccharide deacetylase n=1 Tax=Clostridium niameyense TaxID=1622073 RepID=A0A6M0R5T6_9CLOT|nr:hypothetical protein [Clostridium niameyense]NEZ45602.1 hypothetical protein [Clostridium niameyense]
MKKKEYTNRCDTGIRFILKCIFLNNRFDYYDYYLKLAKQKGYVVTSFKDYLENYRGKDQKVMILRHDVDNLGDNVKEMFKIEKKNQVKSTYYFRWCTFDHDLIRNMDNEGFEVGLHYETLATYCLENHIDKVDNNIINICKEKLKEEIEHFKDQTGISIRTIANHGHNKNIEIGVSNNVLLEGEDYKKFRIISEAYDKDFYKHVDKHIMDTNILTNFGFAYKSNPIESLNRGDKVIVFLAHPEHWKFDFITKLKLIVKLILGRFTLSTNREFKRIENKGI